jgi:hypothetical protein
MIRTLEWTHYYFHIISCPAKYPYDAFGLYAKARELRSCAMAEEVYMALFTCVNGGAVVARQVVW